LIINIIKNEGRTTKDTNLKKMMPKKTMPGKKWFLEVPFFQLFSYSVIQLLKKSLSLQNFLTQL